MFYKDAFSFLSCNASKQCNNFKALKLKLTSLMVKQKNAM